MTDSAVVAIALVCLFVGFCAGVIVCVVAQASVPRESRYYESDDEQV